MSTPSEAIENRNDFGLGQKVAEESRRRLLNQDGSFNVTKRGIPFYRSLSLYHSLLFMTWWKFYACLLVAFLGCNFLFAGIFFWLGPESLRGLEFRSDGERFFEAFNFSVQTMSTIGYGGITPRGTAANLLVVTEVLVGLLGLALATGFLFARFSRPGTKILFSRHAVIAPYRGISALEFRIANERNSQLTNVQATVVLSRRETVRGRTTRRFHQLKLERSQVMFLPLHWVVVHPIDESSPLSGVTEADLASCDAEFLVLLTMTEETFSQEIHSRSSYKFHEVVWGARFGDMFVRDDLDAELLSIDLRRLHQIEMVTPPV